MNDTHTDLVIQISTSEPPAGTSVAQGAKDSDGRLVQELRGCLRPGAEIALLLGGFVATTSILWLSGPLEDGGLRAGVRLLGVSALPAEKPESALDLLPPGNVRWRSDASIAR